MWSIGLIAYEIIFGLTPFADADPVQEKQNILTKDVEFRWQVSVEFQDFIQKVEQHILRTKRLSVLGGLS